MKTLTPSEEIDAIIALHDDWKGKMLARLRKVVLETDPRITEMVKWKKSRPSPKASPYGA